MPHTYLCVIPRARAANARKAKEEGAGEEKGGREGGKGRRRKDRRYIIVAPSRRATTLLLLRCGKCRGVLLVTCCSRDSFTSNTNEKDVVAR